MSHSKITIEFFKEAEGKYGGWVVSQGDKYAENLGYDEMIGLLIALTAPEKLPHLQWMKTQAEHDAYRKRINSNNFEDNLLF